MSYRKKGSKKIYTMKGKGMNKYWELTDEFSGYLLKSQTTNLVGTIIQVENLVDSLPDSSGFNFMDIT